MMLKRLVLVLLCSLQLVVAASPTPAKPSRPQSSLIKPSTTKPSPTKPKPTSPSKPPPTTPIRKPSAPTSLAKPKPASSSKPPPTAPIKRPSKPISPSKKPSSGLIPLGQQTNPPFSSLFSLSTDNTTYAFNKSITVTFNSLQPRRDDFIAIFPASTDVQNLTKGLFWLWLCNQQGNVCSTASTKGQVVFGPKGPASAWDVHWPLAAGKYRAYLLRDAAKPPYTAIAQTRVFTVVLNFKDALKGAKAAIAALIQKNNDLIPQFLRLIFHDCVGGCDGCIDLNNPDNSGLANAMNVLTAVVDAFANKNTGLTRADIWSMSAIVATDVADKSRHKPINFTYNWVGRVNCEDANTVCRNSTKHVVPCAPTRGPHRAIPGPNLNTTGFFAFFEEAFGFNKEQAMASMGAHSVGRLFRQNSGIDGPHGWQINNNQVRSEYYQALLGSATSTSTSAELLTKSPRWDHFFLANKKFNRPDRFYWRLNVVGRNLTMTNADIAMVRDLNDNNMNATTGQVHCAFNPDMGEKPVCPLAGTISIAQKFLNNDVWLSAFKSVLDLISTNGYVRKSCGSSVCRLVRKVTVP